MAPLTADSTSTTFLVLLAVVAVFLLAWARPKSAKRASDRRSAKLTLGDEAKRQVKEIDKLASEFVASKEKLWRQFKEFKGNVKAFSDKADIAYRAYEAEKKAK